MTILRISELAQKYTGHDMIEAYTALPPYPENRARLLYSFLHTESGEHELLYALAVSLAQLGLDTHDLVDEMASEELPQKARSRQINVLAGDYFNGRFYQLLSQVGRIDIVRLVSKSICEVNRMKMNVYERFRELKFTAEEYLEQLVSIKSELFLAFAGLVPERYADGYKKILRAFVRCEVISEELRQTEAGEDRCGYAFWYRRDTAFPEEMNAREMLSDLLRIQVAKLSGYVEKLDSERLKADIGLLIEPFGAFAAMPAARGTD